MRWLAEARERARALLFRRRDEAELEEELRFHLEMEARKLEREGVAPEEARRRAAIAFGGVEKYREEVRDARGLAWWTGLALDLKLGARMLVKYPGMTIVGGLGIAVGVAISVGFFAFSQGMLYPDLPLEEGDRIVALENWDVEVNNEERQALHDFVEWREELTTVRELGAFRTTQRNLITGEGPAEPIPVAQMTASGFQVARVPPLLGRYLVAEDERPGATPVLVIGYDAWVNRFARDPRIVGREVRLGTQLHTIVGVMPEGFAFPMSHRYWTALRADPAAYERGEGPEIFIFGRLAPGVTREEAQAELSAVGRRAAVAYPETHRRLRPQVHPYTYPLTDIQNISLWEVAMMELMVTLILVVVAVNVAVLVYARTATRMGEIAIRSALGASRRRVVAQLFLEALVLSAAAAAAGLVLAHFGMRLGYGILEQEFSAAPFWTDYGLTPATVLYAVGLTVFSAAVVGVLPALQATGRQLQQRLRQLGGGTGLRLGRTWTALIVAQVAIAVCALPAVVALGWTEIRNATSFPTYDRTEYLVAGLAMDRELPLGSAEEEGREAANARYGALVTELERRLEAEPAVVGVTHASSVPGGDGLARVEVEGVPMPAESPTGHRVNTARVGIDFFEVFGAPVLAGRGLRAGDLAEGATPVVVNETFVRRVLGGADPLGRRVRYRPMEYNGDAAVVDTARWYEIVGVTRDLERNPLDAEMLRPRMYHAGVPGRDGGMVLLLRARGDAAGFVPRLREVATALDPTLRIARAQSLVALDRQAALAIRLVALIVGLVVAVVLLLSAAGIYALMSFTVTRRRREIGIRSALGAPSGRVLASVFSRAAGQIALGVAVGAAAALALDRASGGEMMGGEGALLLPAVAVLMTVVGLLAAFGPARRGLRIQPMEALREE